jgi:TP901 family phage tail tape measure protein
MADYAVSTAFTGKDGVTDKLKAMAHAADRFGHDAKGAFDRAGHAGLSFKKIVGGILSANVISRGMGMLGQGIRNAASGYIEFDDAVTAAAAHFDSGYARGSDTFKALGAAAREVGATTEYSAMQAAKGLDFLAKAGLDPTFAMKTLKSYVDLATASGEEFESATSMAVDTMGAFRLNTGTAEEQIAKFTKANDVLVKTVNISNIGLADLFETVKDAGPVAVTAGVSLEKFGAMAAYIGGSGIKGSVAGTALKNALLNMAAPTPRAIEGFRNLGIRLRDLKGNLLDPITIFNNLRKSMTKMGTAQRAATLELLFGKLAIAGAAVSVDAGEAALRKFETALLDSGGEAKKTAELMRQSIGKRIDLLKASAMEMAFKFIDAFEKKIPGGIDTITESIRKFDIKPVVESVLTLGKGLLAVCGVIRTLTPLIIGMTGAWAVYNGIMKAMALAEVVTGFLALTSGLRAATAAQVLFNYALVMNPIGVVIVAVGLLATAGYMLYKQWDNIKYLFKELWSWMKEKFADPTLLAGFQVIGEWLSSFFKNVQLGFSIIGGAIEKFQRLLGIKTKMPVPVPVPVPVPAPMPPTPPPLIPPGGQSSPAVSAVADNPLLFPPQNQSVQPVESTPESNPKKTTQQSSATPRIAPNKSDIAMRNIAFSGRLDIAGAPPGSKLRSKTIGAPPIRAELMGANQ